MRKICCIFVVVMLGIACVAPCGARTPALRAGVSVEMVVTQHAVAMPEVDEADSLIVAVTQKGTIYLEITTRTPAQLTEELKKALAGRSSKGVSVKADARVRYSSVEGVLAALHEAGVTSPALLTSQTLPADKSTYLLPKGLRVSAGAAPPPAIRVSAQSGAPGLVGLTIGGVATNSTQFHADLVKAAQGRPGRGVALTADPALTYGDVVRVIDVCVGAGMGVTVVLPSR